MNLKVWTSSWLFAVALLLALAGNAAASPYSINYGGRLTDPSGKPISGNVTLRVQFFRDETGGVAVPVMLPDFPVQPNAGIFQLPITLSDADFHTIFNGVDQTWIQLKDITHDKTYPRQSYGAVPYALKVPVDPNTLTYDNDGKLTLSAPLEDGKYLSSVGGQLSWQPLTGGGDMAAGTYDNSGTTGVVDNSEKLNGQAASFYTNASNITTGTLADAQIPAAIARDSEIAASARGSVSATAPLNYVPGTGVFSMGAASGVSNGYLSSSDFITFNNKVSSVNGDTGIVVLDAADIAPTATRLWLSDTDKAKLDGVTAGANMLKSVYDSNDDGKVTSAVTADNATQLNGQAASYYRDATNINAGSIGDAYIPATIARDSEIAAGARGAVSGTAPVDYNSGTGAFSMQPASGSVNGYLSSGDFTTFNGKQAAITAASNITLNNLISKGDIKLDDDDASAGVTIKAKDATTASYVLTLPDDDGTVGQFMTTDGNGALSWTSPSSGGDMFKATYDSGNNSKVDVADSADNALLLGGQNGAFYRDGSNINAGTVSATYIDAAIARDTEIPATTDALTEGTTNKYMTAAEKTKLSGIEALADVTDATNVDAAGAVMNGDFSSNGLMSRTGAGTYSVVTDNSANWNTAFGWGNHAGAGYLTSIPWGAPPAIGGTTPAAGTFTTVTGNSVVGKVDMKLEDDDASAVVTLKAKDATTASYTLTLPDDDGTVGQFMTTDGNGALSWTSPSSGGDMFKATYDSGNNSKVDVADTADLLSGQNAAYYLNTDNHTSGTTNKVFTAAEQTLLSGLNTNAVVDGDFGANGIMVRTAAGVYNTITDSSTNWNTAYTDRNKWDGGATGLVAATARTSLSLVPGTDVQAYDAGLLSIAGLTTLADKMIYTTASDTYATTDLTATARTLLDDTSTANMRTTLGVAIGSNVQAYDATLGGIAATAPTADQLIYANGADTFATTGLTSFGRDLLDDASVAAQRTTLGLGTMATQAASAVAITGGTIDVSSVATSVQGGVTLKPYGVAAGETGELRLNDLAAGGTFSAAIKAPDTLGAGYTLTLPTTDGNNNEVLKTDGSGVLSWVAQTAVDSSAVDTAGAVMNTDFGSNGIMTRTGAGTYAVLTDNSTNWNTAYTDRFKWDGGATGLVAATARTSLSLVPGTDVQAYDAGLLSIAGLTTLADKMIYTTASDTYATTDLTATARTLLDDTSTANMRTTLGVAIGSNVQAYDATLGGIAATAPTADQLVYANGADTFTTTGFTSFGRDLLDDASVAAQRTTLGLGSMATQASTAVSISGGTLTSVTLTTPVLANDAISGDKVDGGTISNFASTGIDDNAAATAITVDATSKVGIGTVSPSTRLDVRDSTTGTNASNVVKAVTVASDSTNYSGGVYSLVTEDVAATKTDSGHVVGGTFVGYNNAAGTLGASYGVLAYAGSNAGSTGNTNSSVAVQAATYNLGNGVMANGYGLTSTITNSGTGSITNGYGVLINDVGATSGWGVYQIGANDKNYFAGNVGVGTVSSSTTQMAVVNDTASDTALLVKGAASQSGNLQEWQNSAGTVVAAIGPTGVPSFAVSGGVPNGMQRFTANGTFTVPAGVTKVYVQAWGGGGGGAYYTTPAGSAGGQSTFGAYCTANGGAGGTNAAGAEAAGGTASGGDLNITGQVGARAGYYGGYAGGTAPMGGGSGGEGNYFSYQAGDGTAPGGGGGGAGYISYGSGGGAGGYCARIVTGLTPGGTVAVTVGGGGAGGSNGGNGAQGWVIVNW